MNLKNILPATVAAFALSFGTVALAQTETELIAKARESYPMKTCLVSGEELGSLDEAASYVHRASGKPDQVLFLCCEGCIDDFKADPAKYLEKLNAAGGKPAARSGHGKHAQSGAAAKGDYPMEVCAVSGKRLGSMGEPFDYKHQEAGQPDRLVRMCCEGCVKSFKKDPAKYLARIDAAAKKAKGSHHE